MNCKCQGCNSHSRSMGAMIGDCNWWCRAARKVRSVVNFVNDLGILPPGVNVLVNAGTHALGADNTDTPAGGKRQLNQRVTNARLAGYNYKRMGEIPKIF